MNKNKTKINEKQEKQKEQNKNEIMNQENEQEIQETVEIKTGEKEQKNDEVEKLKKKSSDKLAKEVVKLKRELEEKTKEANNYLDKYKRTLADVENIRKRAIVEKQDNLKYGTFKLIEDLVVILDDFQRAIDHAKTTENMDISVFTEGIEMIEKQFIDLLFKKYGVEKFGEEGEEFNPSLHTAMMVEEGDFDEEVILQVFRKGYILHDRVIRPAQVKVGKPA